MVILRAGLWNCPRRPQPAAGMLRDLRTLACRAAIPPAGHRGLPAGAVHLNLPFSKPLEPVAVLGDIPDAPTAAWQEVWEGRAAAYRGCALPLPKCSRWLTR